MDVARTVTPVRNAVNGTPPTTSLITFASQQVVATATQTATSTTSLTIGTGSKTLAVQAGKAFQLGQWVLIQETSNSANQMLGLGVGWLEEPLYPTHDAEYRQLKAATKMPIASGELRGSVASPA